MKKVIIIPARLKSKRFPGKLLKTIAGMPILQRVWNSARKVKLFDEIRQLKDQLDLQSL